MKKENYITNLSKYIKGNLLSVIEKCVIKGVENKWIITNTIRYNVLGVQHTKYFKYRVCKCVQVWLRLHTFPIQACLW